MLGARLSQGAEMGAEAGGRGLGGSGSLGSDPEREVTWGELIEMCISSSYQHGMVDARIRYYTGQLQCGEMRSLSPDR